MGRDGFCEQKKFLRTKFFLLKMDERSRSNIDESNKEIEEIFKNVLTILIVPVFLLNVRSNWLEKERSFLLNEQIFWKDFEQMISLAGLYRTND